MPGFTYFHEEYAYDTSFISQHLDSDRLMNHLIEIGILKPMKAKIKFTYVGIITKGNKVFIILPKYVDKYVQDKQNIAHSMNEERNIRIISTILKVLKKFPKHKYENSESSFFTSSNVLDGEISEIALADFIIKDYIYNGLYEKSFSEVVLNGFGEINWTNTMEKIHPLISSANPIYVDTYSIRRVSDPYHIVTQLHEQVLKVCIGKYGKLLDYNISDMETSTTELELDAFGGYEYSVSIIGEELGNVFSDRQILLLKALAQFIENKYEGSGDELSLYGTTHFNTVWEEVCREVLSLHSGELARLIPPVLWTDKALRTYEKDKLKPDIVRVLDNRFLIILDAKYYDIKQVEGDMLETPGVSDIGKQFLYEMALKHETGLTDAYNLLLYPHEGKLFGKDYDFFGTASMGFLGMHPITNTYINADKLYSLYLDDKRLSDDEILGILNELQAFRALFPILKPLL